MDILEQTQTLKVVVTNNAHKKAFTMEEALKNEVDNMT